MSYYRHHVFFCLNQRDGGENCCNNHGATELLAYAKKRIKELKLNGRGLCGSTRPAAWTAATRGR